MMNIDPEPYSLEALRARMAVGWAPAFVFFWGHTADPRKERIGSECLSQWYPAPFELDGHLFLTAEHYMMFRKAELFGDGDMATQILSAPHPSDAKALGRAVRGYDDDRWEAARFDVVVTGSVAKFSQNQALGAFLRSTHPRVLVEASPRDRVWGIGLGGSNPAARDPDRWRGRNLLGFALMKARARLVG